MKVLMFGWEFPPHILGGLGTATYGIIKGLSLMPDMDITLCLPKPRQKFCPYHTDGLRTSGMARCRCSVC